MEEAVDECSEALERGGVFFECPICFEKKREKAGRLKFCCGKYLCDCCEFNHIVTCSRRSPKLTCPYCRAEDSHDFRLLKKQGEYPVLEYMTHI